jgi:hypothetical protein
MSSCGYPPGLHLLLQLCGQLRGCALEAQPPESFFAALPCGPPVFCVSCRVPAIQRSYALRLARPAVGNSATHARWQEPLRVPSKMDLLWTRSATKHFP